MGEGKQKPRRQPAHGRRRRLAKETLAAESGANPTPSWRQVEALRERRALINELADIWSENPELDDTIFFSDKESRRFYQRPVRLQEDDFEVDEDAEPSDED